MYSIKRIGEQISEGTKVSELTKNSFWLILEFGKQNSVLSYA